MGEVCAALLAAARAGLGGIFSCGLFALSFQIMLQAAAAQAAFCFRRRETRRQFRTPTFAVWIAGHRRVTAGAVSFHKWIIALYQTDWKHSTS